MLNHLKRFVKDESGAAAIEYGLLTSGISVASFPPSRTSASSWSRSSPSCKTPSNRKPSAPK
ncbi:MAG: Flp family type IVb pilin [Xanthobacteraceae bacterium]